MKPTLSLPSPETSTRTHVDTVLSVLATLEEFLIPKAVFSESSVPSGPPARLEGEASIAASTTFIHACARLDSIFKEEARWSVDHHLKTRENFHALQESQLKFLAHQTAAAAALARPRLHLKPDLVRLEDGTFVAYTGDVSTPGCGLVGRGKTPAEAYDDFDAAFTREASSQVFLEPQPKSPRKKK